ncbi:MAG: hypothetical protein R3B90_22850 [Planctomycetaceae bacterium]
MEEVRSAEFQRQELLKSSSLLRESLEGPLEASLSESVLAAIPLRQTIIEYREELENLRLAADTARSRVDDARIQFERKRTALHRHTAQTEHDLQERLQAARQRRDEGWKLIRTT